MSGVRKEETYRSSDPVYGETDQHATGVGAKAEEAWHGLKSSVPGTQEHAATHPSTGVRTEEHYRSSDPVYGQTGQHDTGIGAKAEEAWHGLKSSVPGTQEYEATHPAGGMSQGGSAGAGPGYTSSGTGTTMSHETGMGTGMGTGAHHTVQNPATGEVHHHSTQTGAAMEKGFQDLKSKVPGTKEHEATHFTRPT